MNVGDTYDMRDGRNAPPCTCAIPDVSVPIRPTTCMSCYGVVQR